MQMDGWHFTRLEFPAFLALALLLNSSASTLASESALLLCHVNLAGMRSHLLRRRDRELRRNLEVLAAHGIPRWMRRLPLRRLSLVSLQLSAFIENGMIGTCS
mmetsp:Transcript_111690/g.193097  ORF Transcript_111690/g.193097 Transcript_111690/m.193097 type:complete len:103 (-) Transcript_111690:25-333(-)